MADEDVGETDGDEADDDDEYHDCEGPPASRQDNIFPENIVRDHVGRFYLWLEGVLLIPAVKVQAISEGLTLLLECLIID